MENRTTINSWPHKFLRLAVRTTRTAGYLMLCFMMSALAVPSMAGAQETAPEDLPPEVGDLSFDPERPETGQKLLLHMNLRNTVRAEVKWTLNEEEIGFSGTGVTDYVVFPKAIKAGDKIKATVTPVTAFGQSGDPKDKEAVCYRAPLSLSFLYQNLDSALYKAKINAEDPQGGLVTLTLLEGPQGMNLDQEGNITWKLGKGASGTFPVKVSAKDEQGD